MNWPLVAILSIPGLLMGLLSVRGHTRGIEPYLWVILGVFAALVVARTAGSHFFQTGLAVGIAWGVLNGATAAALFPVYARHNPDVLSRFAAGGGPAPQAMFVMSAPVIGLVTGLVLGALCWGAARVVPPAASAASSPLPAQTASTGASGVEA